MIMGVFAQFLLGTITKWRTIAAICTVFPILSIVTLFFIPESPYWLLTKGRLDEAKQSLAWLRGWVPVHCVDKEFNDINDVLARSSLSHGENKRNDGSFVRHMRLYGKPTFLVPYALVSLTFFIGHFSGKTALQTYAVQVCVI